ncbi:hexokinase [candidate division KSB3 bacterium]|uniref:Hexokinase n=1 Tax=candidate division KSB3 bacterium TaxID=2044937 RepID=A0A2G6E722_9BACT|nr:MAG: hexokinase [candidate division KSB3 bacterium]PIE30151.1 MAG: hexokinase [candidate division KSB3 bacterium]
MPFDIRQEQLLDIASVLTERIREGLAHDNREIACLPCYIPLKHIPQKGDALVMDFGGTNVRAALVSLDNRQLHIKRGPVAHAIPLKRGETLDRESFLNNFSELIASLHPPQDLPLGYCFSYPTASTPDGDARLLRWSKEVFVENTIGRKVGRLLLEHMASQATPVRCSKVSVINDTVASALAGLMASEADEHIGLIVGTGHNLAAVLDGKMVPKLAGEIEWTGALPVNLESGNLYPPHLTEYDDQLDARSTNPGKQRLEKAVSGVYLAHLLKIACPESRLEPESGSKGLADLAYRDQHPRSQDSQLARQILTRSAKLTAAALTGLIRIFQDSHTCNSVCIAAEGGLFWGDPHYKDQVAESLQELLASCGMSHISFSCVSVEHANLLGSAAAALSGSNRSD